LNQQSETYLLNTKIRTVTDSLDVLAEVEDAIVVLVDTALEADAVLEAEAVLEADAVLEVDTVLKVDAVLEVDAVWELDTLDKVVLEALLVVGVVLVVAVVVEVVSMGVGEPSPSIVFSTVAEGPNNYQPQSRYMLKCELRYSHVKLSIGLRGVEVVALSTSVD
jgi:hypothetical protein